jgi:putative nucleotidyltransferase with HDIG domain
MGTNNAGIAWKTEEQKAAIGQPLVEFFSPWKDEILRLQEVDEGHIELTTPIRGEPAFFDVEVSPLRDWREQLLGRVLIAREITSQKKMEQKLRELNMDLESLVEERTRELEQAYDSTLEGWAKALELKDKETEGHSRRVTDLTIQLAMKLGCSDMELENVRRGALLHDIGKMAIPDEILNKPGPLDDSEWVIMKKHTLTAGNLLSHIPYLERALEIPLYHHERWDGQGYPYGLEKDEIPLSARMFTLVDNWDALLSHRPYRPAWPQEKVIAYFEENAGKIFDPDLVGEFLEMVSG